MRKLRKLNPEEVVEEEVLDLDAIGEVLDNAKVLSNEELEEMDVPTPDFEEESDEDTEINEEDLDLDNEEIIRKIAFNMSYLLSGKEDNERARDTILKDFKNGTVGRISFDE